MRLYPSKYYYQERSRQFVQRALSGVTINPKPQSKYNSYSGEQRAQVGRYAVENGNTRAAISKSSARQMKAEYIKTLKGCASGQVAKEDTGRTFDARR